MSLDFFGSNQIEVITELNFMCHSQSDTVDQEVRPNETGALVE